jgi:hypothetical protein
MDTVGEGGEGLGGLELGLLLLEGVELVGGLLKSSLGALHVVVVHKDVVHLQVLGNLVILKKMKNKLNSIHVLGKLVLDEK